MPKRVDRNQPEIVMALRKMGARVAELHVVGKGIPDICVGFRGANYLLEIKTEKGKLTDDQWAWHELWTGQVAIVKTVDEALRAIGAIK